MPWPARSHLATSTIVMAHGIHTLLLCTQHYQCHLKATNVSQLCPRVTCTKHEQSIQHLTEACSLTQAFPTRCALATPVRSTHIALVLQICAISEELLKTEYDALRIVYNRFGSAVSFKPTIATVLSPDVSLTPELKT